MKLALCLLAVVALASAQTINIQSVQDRSNPFTPRTFEIPDHRSLVESVHSSIVKLSKVNIAVPASAPTLQAYSAGCTNAYMELLQVYSNCSSLFPTVSADTTIPRLVQFCQTSQCPSRMQTKFNAAAAACSGADDRAIFGEHEATWRNVQMYSNAVCIQFNNEWCWLKMQKQALLTPDAFGRSFRMNSTVLNDICSECTRRIYQFMLNYGDRTNSAIAAYLDLVCLQINNNYCILVVHDIAKALDDRPDKEAPPDFTVLCVPCFRAYMGRYLDVVAQYGESGSGAGSQSSGSQTNNMLRAFCTRNPAGEYCAAAFNRASAALMPSDPNAPNPCPDHAGPDSTCPSGCSAFIMQYRGYLGCCFRTILNAINAPNGPNSNQTDMLKWYETKCGVAFPPSCSGLAVRAKVVIKNFLYSYYQSNRQQVENKMRIDLAAYLGVATEDVTVESVAATTVQSSLFTPMAAGLTIQYQAIPEDVTKADAMRAQIAAATQIPFGALSSLPLSARENPAEPLSIDPAGNSAEVIVTGAASATGASIAVLAVAAIVALLAF